MKSGHLAKRTFRSRYAHPLDNWIFFKLADNQDVHKISDEVGFRAKSEYSLLSHWPLSAGIFPIDL